MGNYFQSANRILRRLIFFWEFPQVMVGIFFLMILRKKITAFQRYGVADIYFVSGFPGGISLSFFIFIDSNEPGKTRTVKHEYGHTRQSLFLGWSYLLVIGLPSIIRATLWNRLKLESQKYYKGFPENWADRLGGI